MNIYTGESQGFFCTKGGVSGARAGLGKINTWPQAGRGSVQTGDRFNSADRNRQLLPVSRQFLTGDPAKKLLASPLAGDVSKLLGRLLQGSVDNITDSFVFKMVDCLCLYFHALIWRLHTADATVHLVNKLQQTNSPEVVPQLLNKIQKIWILIRISITNWTSSEEIWAICIGFQSWKVHLPSHALAPLR